MVESQREGERASRFRLMQALQKTWKHLAMTVSLLRSLHTLHSSLRWRADYVQSMPATAP